MCLNHLLVTIKNECFFSFLFPSLIYGIFLFFLFSFPLFPLFYSIAPEVVRLNPTLLCKAANLAQESESISSETESQNLDRRARAAIAENASITAARANAEGYGSACDMWSVGVILYIW